MARKRRHRRPPEGIANTPAQKVIDRLGGHQTVANLLGCHVSRVYRWTYPIDKGGTGGSIPHKQQNALLLAARARGMFLEPADFFPRDEDCKFPQPPLEAA